MVKIINIRHSQFVTGNEILAELFADDVEDVTSDMQIVNLPRGKVLASGSEVHVADGSKFSLKSNGEWEPHTK